METRAYSELYLSHTMENLAVMMDYGINCLGIEAPLFFCRFITSGVAAQIESGNPKYLVGHSGLELAEIVIEQSGGGVLNDVEMTYAFGRTPEYWAGWILAYYQWKSCRSFAEMQNYGLDISRVIEMYYPLHEADTEKFCDIADEIINDNISQKI